MKTLFAATALALIMPGVALAQTAPRPTGQPVSETRNLNSGTGSSSVAAATLPDAFETPAATRAPRQAPTATPAPAPAAEGEADDEISPPEVIEAAETALKATIAAAQNGTMNYDDMTPSLATQVREQAPTITPIIQGFGRLTAVEHRGRENGAELFLVTFENAVTQWIVGVGPDDKIAALLFRPAPETVADPS